MQKMLTKEQKGELIPKYRINDKDTGSAEVQISLLTERIRQLTEHFKAHPKDHSSRRGLFKLVGQRRRFLNYLSREDVQRYNALIVRLGLRK